MRHTYFRKAGIEHIKSTAALLRRVHRHDPSYPPVLTSEVGKPVDPNRDFGVYLDDPLEMSRWVAQRHGRTVGHAKVSFAPLAIYPLLVAAGYGKVPRENTIEINKIIVDPTVRNAGVGSHLLKLAMNFAARKRSAVLLVVGAGSPAARLYRRNGFALVDTFTHPSGLDYDVMLHHESYRDAVAAGASNAGGEDTPQAGVSA